MKYQYAVYSFLDDVRGAEFLFSSQVRFIFDPQVWPKHSEIMLRKPVFSSCLERFLLTLCESLSTGMSGHHVYVWCL